LSAVILLVALALAGCNGGMAAYPSIAQRPAEREFAQAQQPVAPMAPGEPDPAVIRQIAAVTAQAARAAAQFDRQAREAEQLATAARDSGIGSEAWAAATTALAALDSARSETGVPMGDLDALQARTALSAAQSNDARGKASYAAVAEADRAVAAIIKIEDARITALRARLKNQGA
jgi:hypothetical protein